MPSTMLRIEVIDPDPFRSVLDGVPTAEWHQLEPGTVHVTCHEVAVGGGGELRLLFDDGWFVLSPTRWISYVEGGS